MKDLIPGPYIIHKYFSPENRLAEVICGLIMVLTFTAATGAAFEGSSRHGMLIAILGCNIAWGIVDGVTYILGNLLNRGARTRLVLLARRAPGDPRVAAAVATRVDVMLGDLLSPEHRDQVRQWIIERAPNIEAEPTRLRKRDLYTGLACFLIVFTSAIPVVLPFVFIKHDMIALRVSNALVLALLFGVGWRWAPFANMSRLKTGLGLLGLGLVLVLITIVLGG
jgi:hypothetical protein